MWPRAADSRRPSALTERGSLKTSTTGTAQSYVYQIPTPVSVSALPMAVHQYAVDFASAQRHGTDDGISPACHGIGRHCDWLERPAPAKIMCMNCRVTKVATRALRPPT